MCNEMGTSRRAFVVLLRLHPYATFAQMSFSKDFVSCTYCSCPAAPLGDFCTDLSFSKDFVSCTYYACPAAPLGDFCTDFVAREGSLRYLSR
jgi:hypothetical protein